MAGRHLAHTRVRHEAHMPNWWWLIRRLILVSLFIIKHVHVTSSNVNAEWKEETIPVIPCVIHIRTSGRLTLLMYMLTYLYAYLLTYYLLVTKAYLLLTSYYFATYYLLLPTTY